MEQINGIEEFSVMDFQHKIEDMKKQKASLKREIDENSLLAIRLREELRAFGSKSDDLKTEIRKLETLIIERQNELGELKNRIEKELGILAIERKTLDDRRIGLDAEKLELDRDKEYQKKRIEESNAKIVRLERDAMQKEVDALNKEKEAEGTLNAVEEDRLKLREAEVRVRQKEADAEKNRADSEKILSDARRLREEAEAEKIGYTMKFEDLRKREEEVERVKATNRSEVDALEATRKELEDRERDVLLDENKNREIQMKLIREVENAKIEQSMKKKLQEELRNGPSGNPSTK